ncbi:MAG: hypothetical protein ACREBC_18550 [Pyrinomonadaceae bacterium]
MTLNKKKMLFSFVAIGVLAVGASIWLLRRPSCPGAYWLNFDVTCRIADSRSDGKFLIEYFDPDTNELRLYLRDNHRDLQIEHPYGKVKNFKDVVSENDLKFNPRDGRSLLVNGEVFPITPK